ncbi:Zinc finger protein 513 [Portunus trituberculatus]|uniref:Zinc finger protein 513 n=1 Tax=Portunus trituberculatus TaxID=210409 RepID=A0A5B7EIY5_PORTR|nr:Zinc finger protein 513 [Portunus trituberculatus]
MFITVTSKRHLQRQCLPCVAALFTTLQLVTLQLLCREGRYMTCQSPEGVESEKQEMGKKGRPRVQVGHTSASKQHMCPYCPYSTRVTTNLRNHMRTHTKEKPFACPECPYRSTTKDHLTKHMCTHTGERPFACPHCPYRTVLVDNAGQSRYRRGGLAPGSHKCTYCDYTTYFTTNLRNHMRRHTGEKPYSCQHCSYCAITKQRLERHMATHARGSKCPTCPFAGTREEMKKHIIAAHGMKTWYEDGLAQEECE